MEKKRVPGGMGSSRRRSTGRGHATSTVAFPFVRRWTDASLCAVGANVLDMGSTTINSSSVGGDCGDTSPPSPLPRATGLSKLTNSPLGFPVNRASASASHSPLVRNPQEKDNRHGESSSSSLARDAFSLEVASATTTTTTSVTELRAALMGVQAENVLLWDLLNDARREHQRYLSGSGAAAVSSDGDGTDDVSQLVRLLRLERDAAQVALMREKERVFVLQRRIASLERRQCEGREEEGKGRGGDVKERTEGITTTATTGEARERKGRVSNPPPRGRSATQPPARQLELGRDSRRAAADCVDRTGNTHAPVARRRSKDLPFSTSPLPPTQRPLFVDVSPTTPASHHQERRRTIEESEGAALLGIPATTPYDVRARRFLEELAQISCLRSTPAQRRWPHSSSLSSSLPSYQHNDHTIYTFSDRARSRNPLRNLQAAQNRCSKSRRPTDRGCSEYRSYRNAGHAGPLVSMDLLVQSPFHDYDNGCKEEGGADHEDDEPSSLLMWDDDIRYLMQRSRQLRERAVAAAGSSYSHR